MSDILAEDHERGCQGRSYYCGCGYDERKDAEIERQRQQIADFLAERDDIALKLPCAECGARGFASSRSGKGCEFCDGTVGGAYEGPP